MADLVCTAGEIAISDMIVAINDRLEDDDYATETVGGTAKMKLDVATDPANPVLYITIDGSTPGA